MNRVGKLTNYLLGEEQRCGLIAEIETPFGNMIFCVLHLDHEFEKIRMAQLKILFDNMTQNKYLDLPHFIIGY